MKYQTRPQKPHVFEAHQWFKNGDHPDDYKEPRQGLENGQMRSWTGEEAKKALDWEGAVVRRYRRPDVPGQMVCKVCNHKMDDHGWIDHGMGAGMSVCPGDYISTDPLNQYVYRSHTRQSFEAMYDLAPEVKVYEHAQQYQKKPVVIEAIQFTNETKDKCWSFVTCNKTPVFDSQGRPAALMIATLEGDHRAEIGDYIIKGVKGEFYPCKPDIFALTYDLVGETKTGIQLIAEERQEQITKHRITVAYDVEHNDDEELALAAAALCTPYDLEDYTEEEILESRYGETPEKWDDGLCRKLVKKPTIERLKIAGALIAAEIDRLLAIIDRGK